EAAVLVGAPLHGGADAVAVAEEGVVAHPDLVAVVEDGAAGEREEDGLEELDLAAVPAKQRREPAADADVDAEAGVGPVLVPHVVPLLVGHHLERELVVVAEE